MNPSISVSFFVFPLVIGAILIVPLLRKYSGLSIEKAFGIGLLTLAAAIGVVIYGHETFMGSRRSGELALMLIARGLLIVFSVPFILRLWGRWIGDAATAEERLPGTLGIRAWFSTANVVVGILLVVSAWFGFGIPPFLGAVVVAGLLAAQPLIRIEAPAVAPASTPDDLSAEREKVLSLLEAGKLTADESAELLQALGESARAPAAPVPLTSGQRLMLIGAALVALGFFLPWFVIDPGKEASRMMSRMQSSVRSSFGGAFEMPSGFPPGNVQLKTGSVRIGGGDIKGGLGWAALLLGLAAALLPYVAATLDPATARTVRMLCLGIGGLIVLYLLTQNLRFVGIGLIMVVGGYLLEAIGFVRASRPAAASRAA